MSAIRHSSGYPISVKGIVLQDRRALLLLNERGEWDLPGGRPEAGEDFARTVEREVLEESGLSVRAVTPIEEFAFEVLPGRFVWIVAWGCRLVDAAPLRLGDEHTAHGWFAEDRFDTIPLPQGYARAIRRWLSESS